MFTKKIVVFDVDYCCM